MHLNADPALPGLMRVIPAIVSLADPCKSPRFPHLDQPTCVELVHLILKGRLGRLDGLHFILKGLNSLSLSGVDFSCS